MALLPFSLPFAELEVGHHLYWQIGDLYLHGQVFLSSWIVIAILLVFVLAGTRGMKRDPMGLQNLLSFSGISFATLLATTSARSITATGFRSSALFSCLSS